MPIFQVTFNITGRKWPTRRLAQIADSNGWTSLAAVQSWAATQITSTWDAAQATRLRNIIVEIVRAFYEIGADGEADGGS